MQARFYGVWIMAQVILSTLGTQAIASESPSDRTLQWTAEEAFEKGMEVQSLRKNDGAPGVVLYDCRLIETDGAGAGATIASLTDAERSPLEPVNAQSRIKKVLLLPDPKALEAWLYVRPEKAELEINGHPVAKGSGDKFFPIPVEFLKQGENEVVLWAQGEGKAEIKVAARRHILESAPERKDEPPHSFRSADGGKTWQPIEGELVIRLSLKQFAAQGSFASPVVDLARSEADPLGLSDSSVQNIVLRAQADRPEGTAVEFAVRTGESPVYDPATWGAWKPLAEGVSLAPEKRFLQWQATLKTASGLQSPVLRGVCLERGAPVAAAPAWASSLKVVEAKNEEIRYTSMPFEYEDPKNPRSTALREKYKLDEVVKEGKTEFEKLVRLRDWVSHQFKFTAPNKNYPAWDADEIMTRKIGFCVQFAITYIQCATSLGYQARYVCGYHDGTMKTAHEVSEVWSDDYKKWIFMDPTPSQNHHGVDPKTLVPLSMLETHERMVKTYYGDQVATEANVPKSPKWTTLIANVKGLSLTPEPLPTADDPPPKDWPSWTKWLRTCYVPRNNFYGRPHPLPRCQGINLWDWTGFWEWNDPQIPMDRRYGFHTARRSDLEWTINQVCYSAACDPKPGLLRIRLGTVTPYFETYLVNRDGKGWEPSPARLDWALHPGENLLEMRVRNQSGVEGPVSLLKLNYTATP